MPDTERSLLQCGRATFHREYYLRVNIVPIKITIVIYFIYQLTSNQLLMHQHSYAIKLILINTIASKIIILSLYTCTSYTFETYTIYYL